MKKVIASITLGFILVSAIVFRIALPDEIRFAINNRINEIPGISGAIGDIDLSLLLGRYSIDNIQIFQEANGQKTPLYAAKTIEFSLSWRNLFKGEFVSDIVMEQPIILATDNIQQKDITESAVLNEHTWLGLVNDLSPFTVDSLSIRNGTIQFNAIGTELFGQLAVTNLDGKLLNLHNDAKSKQLATFAFDGLLADTSLIEVTGSLNPNTTHPTFDINMKMDKAPTAVADQVVKIYAPFDLEAGELDMAMELKSKERFMTGYVKVGLYDIDVFSFKEDIINDGDNPFKLFIEGVSGLVASVLENDHSGSIATRIPINGSYDSPEVSNFDAIAGLFRHAFIEAYSMDIEDIVEFTPKKSSQSE